MIAADADYTFDSVATIQRPFREVNIAHMAVVAGADGEGESCKGAFDLGAGDQTEPADGVAASHHAEGGNDASAGNDGKDTDEALGSKD